MRLVETTKNTKSRLIVGMLNSCRYRAQMRLVHFEWMVRLQLWKLECHSHFPLTNDRVANHVRRNDKLQQQCNYHVLLEAFERRIPLIKRKYLLLFLFCCATSTAAITTIRAKYQGKPESNARPWMENYRTFAAWSFSHSLYSLMPQHRLRHNKQDSLYDNYDVIIKLHPLHTPRHTYTYIHTTLYCICPLFATCVSL